MSIPTATPMPTPTSYSYGSYVAQCASGGVPGPVYADPQGNYQDYDYDTVESACNAGCLQGQLLAPQNTNENVNNGYEMPIATCNATGQPTLSPTTYMGVGATQGGGPVQTVSQYGYGVNTSGAGSIYSGMNYAGLAGGNASSGLTHMQIALILLLVLLVCGTGGFLLFRHMKK